MRGVCLEEEEEEEKERKTNKNPFFFRHRSSAATSRFLACELAGDEKPTNNFCVPIFFFANVLFCGLGRT